GLVGGGRRRPAPAVGLAGRGPLEGAVDRRHADRQLLRGRPHPRAPLSGRRAPGVAGRRNGDCSGVVQVLRALRRCVVVAAATSLLVACGGGTSKTPAVGGAKQAGGGTTVVLKDLKFNPVDIAVGAGETVTWLWEDGSIVHNVVDDKGRFTSGG